MMFVQNFRSFFLSGANSPVFPYMTLTLISTVISSFDIFVFGWFSNCRYFVIFIYLLLVIAQNHTYISAVKSRWSLRTYWTSGRREYRRWACCKRSRTLKKLLAAFISCIYLIFRLLTNLGISWHVSLSGRVGSQLIIIHCKSICIKIEIKNDIHWIISNNKVHQ